MLGRLQVYCDLPKSLLQSHCCLGLELKIRVRRRRAGCLFVEASGQCLTEGCMGIDWPESGASP